MTTPETSSDFTEADFKRLHSYQKGVLRVLNNAPGKSLPSQQAITLGNELNLYSPYHYTWEVQAQDLIDAGVIAESFGYMFLEREDVVSVVEAEKIELADVAEVVRNNDSAGILLVHINLKQDSTFTFRDMRAIENVVGGIASLKNAMHDLIASGVLVTKLAPELGIADFIIEVSPNAKEAVKAYSSQKELNRESGYIVSALKRIRNMISSFGGEAKRKGLGDLHDREQ